MDRIRVKVIRRLRIPTYSSARENGIDWGP